MLKSETEKGTYSQQQQNCKISNKNMIHIFENNKRPNKCRYIASS